MRRLKPSDTDVARKGELLGDSESIESARGTKVVQQTCAITFRRGRESNPRIAVLQTATLPLGYPAGSCEGRNIRVSSCSVNHRKRSDGVME